MTVSRAISSLYLFRSKIDEAVSLVPGMCAEDKLKAVQFWNMVSEKLQDIVNSSAADINAVALKMDEEETAKMNLDMSNQGGSMIHQNTLSDTDCVNISTNYAICSESVTSSHLKQFLPSTPSFLDSNKQTSGSDNIISPHIHALTSGSDSTISPHIHSLNHDVNSGISDCNISGEQILNIENIPITNCDTFSKDTQPSSHLSILDTKSDYRKIDTLPHSPRKKSVQLQSSWEDKKTNTETNENFDVNSSSPTVIINHKSPKKSEGLSQRDSIPQNSCNSDINLKCDSEVPLVKCKENEKSVTDLEASNESDFEQNEDFDISNFEEALETSEISQSVDSNLENSTDNKTNTDCKICAKSFSDDDALARHHLRVHEKHYGCSECKAKFTTKGNLIVHMRRHTGEKPFCCNKCPANFTTKGNLQRHIKTHSGEKPWQCNRCGTCFTEKKSLTVHMRRHTGERPYQCKVCGKSFSQTSILQTHMAMHMDLKIHLCEKCGKSFRQKSQLRVHRQRHDNVRPFKCSSCSSSFLTRGDLIRHEKTHTREKPFPCDMCAKSFTRQQSLNEHKNRHYGIKPYKCKHCGKAFPEMSGCYKHMKCHEKVKEVENIKADETEPAEQTTQIITNETPDIDAIENQLPNVAETPSYIAVVLNTKDPNELGNEINQAVTFLNSGLEENNIVSNGIGVFTAINILANASTLPQNFQSVS